MDRSQADPITTTQTNKKEKDNTVVLEIIKQGVNGNVYINIIGKKNSQRFRKTLHRVYLQVGQRLIYFILKELLNYPRVVKSHGYEKKANTIFAKFMQLIQKLQLAIIEQRTIWESITLILALNLLHNDFEMTTAP